MTLFPRLASAATDWICIKHGPCQYFYSMVPARYTRDCSLLFSYDEKCNTEIQLTCRNHRLLTFNWSLFSLSSS